MEKRELVSVIVPVYNVEKYLQECVDSVLAQTYEKFEIILVDDGSTDKSGTICDTYQKRDSRIVVIHQENRGLSEARNAGLNRAKGEYIYFLDSDDWILSETLEKLVEKAKAESAEVVFFDAYSFEDNQPEKQTRQHYMRKHSYKTDTGLEIFKKLQEYREYHSAVPLLLIKKSVLERSSLKFEPGILYEDMIFTYALFCKAERVAYINEPFYQRRYRNNSIMTSKKKAKNYSSAKQVYLKVKEISEPDGLIKEDSVRAYITRCAFNAMNNYVALSNKEQQLYRDDYQSLKKHILQNHAYGNKALYYRCYGIIPWAVYKIYEKAITGLKGK